jgi:hypothetical protein
MVRRAWLLSTALVVAVLLAPAAAAAAVPAIDAEWVTGVTSSSAVLRAEIDPEGSSTRYHFEYLTLVAYEANLEAGHEPFAGATMAPVLAIGLGSGTSPVPVSFTLTAPNNPLAPGTAYRYRAVAVNAAGTTPGPVRLLKTRSAGPAPGLPDGRAWEMVSPIDKGGGSVAAPGGLFGGGEIQAAAGGGALTYGSATAFGDPLGAPPASQYVSIRGAGGWSTVNISAPLEAGGYGDQPDGVPYRLFSDDLGRALLLNPRRCEPDDPCPRSYSLRDTATGTLTPLPAQAAGMRVLSASSDLGRVIFEGEGGTYEWSGGGLVPIDLLPPSAGAGAAFQAGSADGRFTFYTEGGRLYRYDAASEAAIDLTPAAGVAGVLGASLAGDIVYFQDASGLQRWHAGMTTTVAVGADATLPSDYPPATATVRLTGDGGVLAFLSAAPIGEFDNRDAETGLPDTEVYVYDAGAGSLLCASCNPTGERPAGSASIPGALVNGTTTVYRPRALSADGRRLFFDSEDALGAGDTDSRPDVYQWEAPGEGTCAEAPGCVSLISGGRGEGGSFLDASADGADTFFLTGDSLVGSDPGSIDAYDARVGGGLPEPEAPIPCQGDACQPLPSPPEDPTAGTSIAGPTNPPPHYTKERRHRHKHHHRRHRRHHHAHRGHHRKGQR